MLTKAHLDQLVTDLTAGSFPGHKRPWMANSINPMLNLVSRVLADLVRQGSLARDVAALVERLKRPETKLTTFTEKEVRRVLKHFENDRLGQAWHLALAGLRRGEISGLRWSDVELDDDRDAGTLTIAHNRVWVGGQVHDTDPKTERSARTLPLTPGLAKALKRAKALQAAERLRLGPSLRRPGRARRCRRRWAPVSPRHAQRLLARTVQRGQGEADSAARRTALLRQHHARAGGNRSRSSPPGSGTPIRRSPCDLCARAERRVEGGCGHFAEGCDTLVTPSHQSNTLAACSRESLCR
jgi:integrase